MNFLNGLKEAVPYDLWTRCVEMKMTEAPEGCELRDALEESVEADAALLREALHAWSMSRTDEFRLFMKGRVRRLHPKLEKRKRQKWGPIFAAAHAAGGSWPRWIYDAFVEIELDADERPRLLAPQFTLLDTANILMRSDARAILMSDLIEALRALPEGSYYREVETEHLVYRVFPEALGEPCKVTAVKLYGDHAGEQARAKGWSAVRILREAAELHDTLYPQYEDEMEDPLEEELAFELVTPGNTATGRRKK
jgi:hypothetical protein